MGRKYFVSFLFSSLLDELLSIIMTLDYSINDLLLLWTELNWSFLLLLWWTSALLLRWSSLWWTSVLRFSLLLLRWASALLLWRSSLLLHLWLWSSLARRFRMRKPSPGLFGSQSHLNCEGSTCNTGNKNCCMFEHFSAYQLIYLILKKSMRVRI